MKRASIPVLCVVLTACWGRAVVAGDPVLADAAEREDWARVRAALRQPAGVVSEMINAVQPDGMTALHWAVWHDRADLVRLLLDAGADPDRPNAYGLRPLALACGNASGTVVEWLLEAGADPQAAQPGGETPLMTAARTGSVRAVRALLEAQVDVDAVQRTGQTAIMWAAAEGHADVVSLLIRHQADFRRSLKSGFTPLFFAVREGRTEVVDVLLEAGEDVNTVMRPQREGGRLPRSGTSPLLLAVENGHFELAVHLLEKGADPDDQRSGFTPLHVMTWVRKPNSGDGLDGAPPPVGSGRLTSLQCVRALVRHGADVNARLKRGRSGRGRIAHRGATPFLFAADTADVPLMRLLLELGADPTLTNVDDCPPILAAAGVGTLAPSEEAGTEDEALAAVQLLLELGADINAVDRNGETVMHGAAYKSLPKMVRFLAEAGADPAVWNRKNRYGWTPHLIAEGHRPGNFKPAAETLAAIREVMADAGLKLPEPTPRKRVNEDYARPRKARGTEKAPAEMPESKPSGPSNSPKRPQAPANAGAVGR